MAVSKAHDPRISELARTIRGQLVTRDDPAYDAARAVFVGDVDLHPAAVVRAADTDDIARVVGFARRTGLELAVRSGGHSYAGHGTSEGGVVLDLSLMKAIEIDPDHHTAWAEAGLTAGEVTNATAEHGLAIGFGDTASVGIGGITLGGGIGFLVRKYGLTIDSLLAAEVVTADGDLLHADAATNADLFWAIRGGGGNFGVATRFQYRLHELGTVVGGMLMLPATAQSITEFISLAEAAPDELSAIANIMPAPPMPFVPVEQHGSLVIMALMVYAGEVETGERLLGPFRAVATPIVDQLRPMAYRDIYPPADPDYHPMPLQHTMFMDHVDAPAAEEIVEFLQASDAPVRVAQLRVLGGAMARVPYAATAFAHRTSQVMATVVALHDNTPGDCERRRAWVDEFAAALHQTDEGAYVNFLRDEGEARVRAAYPGQTWDRLVAAKARYDPTNLFRRNQNIPPA